MLAVMTISHATDLWLGELTRQGHSDRTVDKYRRLLDKLADAHSRHTDVADLTVVHDVSALLGHASIATTSDLYVHTRADEIAVRLRALNLAVEEQ